MVDSKGDVAALDAQIAAFQKTKTPFTIGRDVDGKLIAFKQGSPPAKPVDLEGTAVTPSGAEGGS